MTFKLAVAASKGGVGKTTVTACLGEALARRGLQVLLIDLDPQADLSSIMGCEPDSSVPSIGEILEAPRREQATLLRQGAVSVEGWGDLITPGTALETIEQEIARGLGPEQRLRDAVTGVGAARYDVVLMDTPKGDGLLAKNAMLAADALLVVLQTEALALKNFDLMLQAIEQIQDRVNPSLHIAAIMPSQVKPVDLARSVLETITTWAESEAAAPYGLPGQQVYVGEAVKDLTLYAELPAQRVSLFKHPNRRRQHTEPFIHLAQYLEKNYLQSSVSSRS